MRLFVEIFGWFIVFFLILGVVRSGWNTHIGIGDDETILKWHQEHAKILAMKIEMKKLEEESE